MEVIQKLGLRRKLPRADTAINGLPMAARTSGWSIGRGEDVVGAFASTIEERK
jgi:hypothetical protein